MEKSIWGLLLGILIVVQASCKVKASPKIDDHVNLQQTIIQSGSPGHVLIKVGCGFSRAIKDEEFELSTEQKSETFENLVTLLGQLAFISDPIVCRPMENLQEIAVAYSENDTNKIGYDAKIVADLFGNNSNLLSRNWQNPKWYISDTKYFHMLFVIAHELAHLTNDHNHLLIDCDLERGKRQRREWIADSTAGVMLYKLNVRPFAFVTKAISQFYKVEDVCYPKLQDRLEAARVGYFTAMNLIGEDVVISNELPVEPLLYLPFEEIYRIDTTNQLIPDLLFSLHPSNRNIGEVFRNKLTNKLIAITFSSHRRSYTQLYGHPSEYYVTRTCSNISYDTVPLKLLQHNNDYIYVDGIVKYTNRYHFMTTDVGFPMLDAPIETWWPISEEKYFLDALGNVQVIDSFQRVCVYINKSNIAIDTVVEYFSSDGFDYMFPDFAGFPICSSDRSMDTIKTYYLSIEGSGDTLFDMGFTFDESVTQFYERAIKVYSLQNCGSQTGLITTNPEKFESCNPIYQGYIILANF